MEKKVAIIIRDNSYLENSLQACSKLNITPEILQWTENLEQDIQNLLINKADILLIQLNCRHHGAAVCREAYKYGIQGKTVTACRGYRYSPEEGGSGGSSVDVIKDFLEKANVFFTDTEDFFCKEEKNIEDSYLEAKKQVEQSYLDSKAKLAHKKLVYAKGCEEAKKRHETNPDQPS